MDLRRQLIKRTLARPMLSLHIRRGLDAVRLPQDTLSLKIGEVFVKLAISAGGLATGQKLTKQHLF